jgi:flagellar protein FlgJ
MGGGDIQSAQSVMTLARATPPKAPHVGITPEATKKAAKDFESVFISQFLGSMFEGISTDGMFGGGQGEQIFRSMMLDQYGKQIAAQGGFGLSDAVTRSLVQHQEAQQRAQQALIDSANPAPKDPEGIAVAKTEPVFAARKDESQGIAVAPRGEAVFSAHPAALKVMP